jgi:hypothetical protein
VQRGLAALATAAGTTCATARPVRHCASSVWGLLESDGERKRAFGSYRRLVRELVSAAKVVHRAILAPLEKPLGAGLSAKTLQSATKRKVSVLRGMGW